MSILKKCCIVCFIVFVPFVIFQATIAQELTDSKPQPRVIKLNPDAGKHQEVLTGPPGTVTMHSGLVILEPDSCVGIHNTEIYEEVLVVLEGKGKMEITGGLVLQFESGNVAYCPPHSEHNVFNTGKSKLKYLYIVAVADKKKEEATNSKAKHKH